jgi:hypothetical protein
VLFLLGSLLKSHLPTLFLNWCSWVLIVSTIWGDYIILIIYQSGLVFIYQSPRDVKAFSLFKMFLLVYKSCRGVLLWHFHICVQCTVVRLIPSIFLPLPLLLHKTTLTNSVFHFHTCIESTSILLTLLYPFHLPSPSH